MAAREFVVYGMQVVRYCSGRHGGLPLRLTAMHTSLYTFILFIPLYSLYLYTLYTLYELELAKA